MEAAHWRGNPVTCWKLVYRSLHPVDTITSNFLKDSSILPSLLGPYVRNSLSGDDRNTAKSDSEGN
jgi:hypothetical protein